MRYLAFLPVFVAFSCATTAPEPPVKPVAPSIPTELPRIDIPEYGATIKIPGTDWEKVILTPEDRKTKTVLRLHHDHGGQIGFSVFESDKDIRAVAAALHLRMQSHGMKCSELRFVIDQTGASAGFVMIGKREGTVFGAKMFIHRKFGSPKALSVAGVWPVGWHGARLKDMNAVLGSIRESLHD